MDHEGSHLISRRFHNDSKGAAVVPVNQTKETEKRPVKVVAAYGSSTPVSNEVSSLSLNVWTFSESETEGELIDQISAHRQTTCELGMMRRSNIYRLESDT